jgi:hypothetical protein
MLLQIRDFIQREKVVSTQQLTREFQLDEQALLPMLDCWVRKGVIHPCQEKTACQSSCFRCNTTRPVYYQYRELA